MCAVVGLPSLVPTRLRIGADVSLSRRRHAVLTAITALGLKDRSLAEVVPEALGLILGLPGLALRPMGCVFLADDAGTHLRMVAHKNMPLADHPWRAVEAGSRFLTLLASYRRERPAAAFDVHIGIETGEALAGDLGPEQRHLYTVAGACVHFASRLTKLAIENRVVVGPGTARALAGQVAFTPWGPVAISGLAGVHPVFLVGDAAGSPPGIKAGV